MADILPFIPSAKAQAFWKSAPAPSPRPPPESPSASTVLVARDLITGHGKTQVTARMQLQIAAGEVLCLLGPNGAGKTTLFRSLLGLTPLLGGSVQVQGRPLQEWSRAELAGHIAYVPQAQAGLFAFTALDMVLMGRAARLPAWSQPGEADKDAAWSCLSEMGVATLAHRPYTELSGGERQLVLIARALAQKPALLIMDEPTASLDFGNQIRVLERLRALRERGMALLMSTHQPEHALQVADRIALLAPGRLMALGPAREVATVTALAQLYEVAPGLIQARLGHWLKS